MRFAETILLCVAVSSCYADEYVFRNDDRPAYGNRVTVSDLAGLRENENLVILDVRLIEDFKADPMLIPGADYKDPEHITKWASEIRQDATVVVYCVKGKWVSQKAAHYLKSEGVDAYSLEGGIEAWKHPSE